jgi:hypothetical protein
VDPITYTGNAFPEYEKKLLEEVANAEMVKKCLGAEVVKTAFAGYMTGELTGKDFANKLGTEFQAEGVLLKGKLEDLLQDLEMLVDFDKWERAAAKCLPEQLKLSEYLSKAKPWNRDVSKEKIGEKVASHQAYAGDAKWWSYQPGAREKLSVRNYQWRAPGEWFADLYAVSWYKKVEPPTGVANAVRPYLFGGHLT